MAHHAGFLRDIIEHPEDDAPRLIYADWLEENGDPDRAEFIRVQCELAARWPQAPKADAVTYSMFPPGRRAEWPDFERLRRRERELLTASHALDWGPDRALWDAGFDRAIMTYWESGESLPPGYAGTLFRRGFVVEVTLPCGQWMRHGPALVRAAPLQAVTLSNLHPSSRPPWHDWYPPWTHDMALAHHDVPAAILPEPLWDALDWPTEDGKGPHEPAMRGYPSEDVALDALSRACLKWARRPSRATH